MATTQFALTAEDQAEALKRSIWYMGGLLTVHADGAQTNGQFSLIEALATPGAEPPLHVHDREDEMFYVLEGAVKVTVGDQKRVVLPGETVFLPRRIPHTFKIVCERARVLILITPAGFEGYFRALGTPATTMTLPADPLFPHISRIQGTANRFGVTFLG